MSRPLNPLYDQLDWSLPNTELAAQLGVTQQAVGAARRRRGIAPVPVAGGKRPGAGRKKNPKE